MKNNELLDYEIDYIKAYFKVCSVQWNGITYDDINILEYECSRTLGEMSIENRDLVRNLIKELYNKE